MTKQGQKMQNRASQRGGPGDDEVRRGLVLCSPLPPTVVRERVGSYLALTHRFFPVTALMTVRIAGKAGELSIYTLPWNAVRVIAKHLLISLRTERESGKMVAAVSCQRQEKSGARFNGPEQARGTQSPRGGGSSPGW